MAGRFNNNEDEPIVDINITPFVDIVLVLLVIFMVTAHFMTNKGINLKLPKAAHSEQLKNQKTFHVAIAKDAAYFLDGKAISMNELKLQALDAVNQKQKVVVTISADKSVVYSSVVSLMDAMRSAGVSDFALQLEPVTK